MTSKLLHTADKLSVPPTLTATMADHMSKQQASDIWRAADEHFWGRTHDVGSPDSELAPCYAFRYQVYCVERGFLDAGAYPEGLESDEYDGRSAHFSVHNRTGELVGTARLVLSPKGEPFPFESRCPPWDSFARPPDGESVEVSRLSVSRAYRRREGDTWAGVNRRDGLPVSAAEAALHPERRSNSPLLVMSLYRQMYQYSRQSGVHYWYAAMEKSLKRVLARFDFVFEQIGSERDYYGPVAPYLGDLRKIERRLARANPDLLAWLQRDDRARSPSSAGQHLI